MTRYRYNSSNCGRVIRGRKIYSTPRELVNLVGSSEAIVWREHGGEMDWCLCVVDLPSTLAHTALRWRQGENPSTFIVDW